MTSEKFDPTAILMQAEDSIGTDLLKGLLMEVQQLQSPWQNTPEAQQQEIIDRLRMRVEVAVREAVRRIACAGFTHIVADIESLTIKDGAKAVMGVARGEGMHELADRVLSRAIIVFADPAEFIGGMREIKASADQPALPL